MASSKEVGIIILGNSGVGKSFLGNLILDRNVFKHKFSPNAVTLTTEYEEVVYNGMHHAVYNIPGLIESDQARIDINIREINIAFESHPYAVIVYVFGHQNGRIRDEDVVAFNAIKDAYPMEEKSLVIIVNNLPVNREDDYESETTDKLTSLLNFHLPYVVYINHSDTATTRKANRQQLLQAIMSALPKQHIKKQEIELPFAKLKEMKKQIAAFQKEIEENREKHKAEVLKIQQDFEEKEKRIQAQTQQQISQLQAQYQANQAQIQQYQYQLQQSQAEQRNLSEKYRLDQQREREMNQAEKRSQEKKHREELDELSFLPTPPSKTIEPFCDN
ncbi:unnamed protein product [Rotaria sp. Silwood2]|nr:unnamed protein product [Rotaria sp. Silwood2]CAF4162318.1 unnamed protein product [Rotaria sp. Silwood2]